MPDRYDQQDYRLKPSKPKHAEGEGQCSLFDGVVPDDSQHTGLPDVAGEVLREDTEIMDAFEDDALSFDDVLDSQDVPEVVPESLENARRQAIERLREQHRAVSEMIVSVNRDLARIAVKAGSMESLEARELLTRLRRLQKQRATIEARAQEEVKALKALDHTFANVPRDRDGKSGLVKARHPNRDFFLADLFDYAMKDDGASMEAPIFTLSTKPDLTVWRWVSKDESRSVNVTPSVLGRATQHDKDVLIYVVSQLTEALNRGREDAKNRVVRFTVYDFLVTTNRGVGGDDYKRLQEGFERLAGTRIKTDIKTGGQRVKENFGIIDKYKIVERAADNERMIAVEITLSEWLYNAVQAHEVLTIHPDYFRLRKPIARRLYELARKHCGHQARWQISLQLLHEKSGSRGSIYEFHEVLKDVSAGDGLPEYRVSLSQARRLSEVKVTFYTRDIKRLAHATLAKLGN